MFIKLHRKESTDPVFVNSQNIDWFSIEVFDPDDSTGSIVRLNRSFDAVLNVRETPAEILALLGEV